MEEFINNLILEHFGTAVVVIIVVTIVLIFIVWKTAKIYFTVKNLKCEDNTSKIEQLSKSSFDKSELPCASHRDKMAEHDNAVTRIETAITYLTKEIDTVLNNFRKKGGTPDGFTQSHSPLSITEAGWTMVRTLGIDKMFEANWQRIKDLIDENVKDKNAYDIDDFCIKEAVVFPEKFLSPENISVLKEDAFRNGFTLTPYMKVVAVMARDRYFREAGIKMETQK